MQAGISTCLTFFEIHLCIIYVLQCCHFGKEQTITIFRPFVRFGHKRISCLHNLLKKDGFIVAQCVQCCFQITRSHLLFVQASLWTCTKATICSKKSLGFLLACRFNLSQALLSYVVVKHKGKPVKTNEKKKCLNCLLLIKYMLFPKMGCILIITRRYPTLPSHPQKW